MEQVKSDLQLAKVTYGRIQALYKDSVVTSQRKDEVEAMYKAAVAAPRSANAFSCTLKMKSFLDDRRQKLPKRRKRNDKWKRFHRSSFYIEQIRKDWKKVIYNF